MTYYDNPLDELKGKTVDAYEMAVKIYEMSKKLKNEDTINGLGYATALLFEMATRALEQEPCDDCVSRQAVLEQTYNWSKDEFLRVTNPFDYLRKRINSLPSVTPERKKGEWCEQNDDYFDWYECSECGYGSEGEMQYSSEHDVRTKYCPNCGAEMVIKSCSTCKHDGELVCATHGCHNKERYEVEE